MRTWVESRHVVFTHGMLDPYFKQRYPLKHVKKAIYWHCILRKILHGANMFFYLRRGEDIGPEVVHPIPGARDGCALWHIRPGLLHYARQRSITVVGGVAAVGVMMVAVEDYFVFGIKDVWNEFRRRMQRIPS